MKVSDITGYLIELEREGFTGDTIIHWHKGSISKKIDKKISEEIKE